MRSVSIESSRFDRRVRLEIRSCSTPFRTPRRDVQSHRPQSAHVDKERQCQPPNLWLRRTRRQNPHFSRHSRTVVDRGSRRAPGRLQQAAVEPTNIVPGTRLSPDKTLLARGFSYPRCAPGPARGQLQADPGQLTQGRGALLLQGLDNPAYISGSQSA